MAQAILGPLLFIIFMNNLPAVVSSCNIQLYADDTIVYCHGKTVDEVKQNLTVGFQTVIQWFQQNCLTVNIKERTETTIKSLHPKFMANSKKERCIVCLSDVPKSTIYAEETIQ